MISGPIAKNTIRTSLVYGLRLTLQAGTLIVLARILNPAGFGTYVSLGALAVVLGAFSSFGTQYILLRDVARAPASNTGSLKLALGTTALCGSLLLPIYVLLSLLWMKPPGNPVALIAFLGVSEILLQPIFMIAVMERHGRGQIMSSQLLLNSPIALRLTAALLIGWASPSELLLLIGAAHLIAILASLALAIATAPTTWPTPRHWRTPTTDEWRNSSGYAFINASTGSVAELDKILAGKLLGTTYAGLYVATSRVIGALTMPIVAMMVSAMPRLFREPVANSRQLHHLILACSLGYGVAAGLGVWVCAPFAPAVFGESYAGMDRIIRWLAWALPGVCLHASAANLLVTLDKPWARGGIELFGWLILATLALIVVPSLGAKGLAFSVACAEWVISLLSWTVVLHASRTTRNSSLRARQTP